MSTAGLIHEVVGDVPTTLPCNIVMKNTVTKKFVVVSVYPDSWKGLVQNNDPRFAEVTIDCAIKSVKIMMLHRDCGTINLTSCYVPQDYIDAKNWLTFVLLDVTLYPNAVEVNF